MATASPVVVLDSTPQSDARRARGKPDGRAPGVPLVIPIGRSTSSRSAERQQAVSGVPAAGSSKQQATHSQQEQQQRSAPAAAGAGPSTQQQVQQKEQQQGQQQERVLDEDVIILDSGSESDSDVVITGVTQRKRPRQVMMQPAQVQQRHQLRTMQVTAPVTGLIVPTWEQPPAVAKQRSPSPEPAIKCLICLEGIKTDNMATTPCGHMFCYDCLCDAVKAMKKCPKCRKTVQPKAVKRLFPN